MFRQILLIAALAIFLVTTVGCAAPAPTPTAAPSPTMADLDLVKTGTLVVTHSSVSTGSFTAVPVGKPIAPNVGDWFVFREASNNPSIIVQHSKEPNKVVSVSLERVQKQYGVSYQTVSGSKSVTIAIKGELPQIAFTDVGTDSPKFAH